MKYLKILLAITLQLCLSSPLSAYRQLLCLGPSWQVENVCGNVLQVKDLRYTFIFET